MNKKKFYFIIKKDGTLEETENTIDFTGLTPDECKLALLDKSDIIVSAGSKLDALALIDYPALP